jgi:hypothetical protein
MWHRFITLWPSRHDQEEDFWNRNFLEPSIGSWFGFLLGSYGGDPTLPKSGEGNPKQKRFQNQPPSRAGGQTGAPGNLKRGGMLILSEAYMKPVSN